MHVPVRVGAVGEINVIVGISLYTHEPYIHLGLGLINPILPSQVWDNNYT